LLGYSNQGTVRNSYVASLVSGLPSTTGAIIGGALDVLMYNCHFNESITGQTVKIGENTIGNKGDDQGMSSEEMRMQAFVNTLNQGLFTPVWKMDYNPPINNGFPILMWQQTTGIATVTNENEIKLYPNPVSDNLIIRFDNKTNDKVLIYDVLGKIVISQETDSNEITVNLTGLSKGFYYLRVADKIVKFVKK